MPSGETRVLLQQLQLILENVNANQSLYVPHDPVVRDTANATGTPYVHTDPATVDMVHPQVTVLKVLYSQCDNGPRDAFPHLLIQEAGKTTAPVIAATLVHLGQVDALLNFLGREDQRDKFFIRRGLWQGLFLVLTFEPHRFTDDELARIDTLAGRERRWALKIVDTISRSRPI